MTAPASEKSADVSSIELLFDLAEQMAEEARLFAAQLQSAEPRKAMTAFIEKRKPDFSRL